MKSIFVTGAASGIGRATALLFGRRGWFVGCYDVDLEGARRTKDEVGDHACHGLLDVRSAEGWRVAVSDFAGRAGERMDVLFNSAGVLRMGEFATMPEEDCRLQLDVNVMGVVLGVQACLPALERAKGAVVTMSSASAIYGQPELAVYSASKFAVRALTEALDLELEPRGVRVTDVMPAYVDTPMVRAQETRAASLDRLGVNLVADDVAEVVWRAAHGSAVHHIPQANMSLMSRFSGLVPTLSRVVMRRMSRR